MWEVLQKLMPHRYRDVGSLTKIDATQTQRCGKSYKNLCHTDTKMWEVVQKLIPHRYKDVGGLTKIDATQIREVLQKLMPQRQKDVGSLTKHTKMWQVSPNFYNYYYFFIWVLQHGKIISLILSRVNHKVGREWEIPEKKT